MKKSARNRIIVWSIISGVLITALVLGVMSIQNFGSIGLNAINIGDIKNIDSYTSGEAELEKSKVKSLDINWTAGQVNLTYGDTDKIVFSEESEPEKIEDRMCWNVDKNGKLSIYACKKNRVFFGISFDRLDSKVLNIEIPKDMKFDDFYISSASADINVDFAIADNVNIGTASGDLEIKDIESDNVDIANVSGKSVAVCKKVDKMSLTTVSGNCTVRGIYSELNTESVSGETNIYVQNDRIELDSDSVSGGININIDKDISGFTSEYDTVSGQFDCDFSGRGTADEFVYGDGSSEINLETVSGSINIESFEANS